MSTTTSSPRRRRRHLATMVWSSALAVMVLSGCSAGWGGPSSTAGASSSASGTGTGGASSSTSFAAQRDAYDLKMAACLRQAGFDIPDPQPGQGIQQSSPQIKAAASTCMQSIGEPPLQEKKWSEAGNAEAHQRALNTAKCLRGLGYNVSDPVPQAALVIPEGVSPQDFASCNDYDPS